MKSKLHHLLLLLAALCLSGCFPEERVWWSPLGDRAIVRVEDRLHLVNADGELGKPLLGGASIKDWMMPTLNWLPDGSGFLCSRVRKVSGWEKTKELISADESSRVEKWLPAVLPTLEYAVVMNESLEKLDHVLAAVPDHQRLMFAAGLRLAFQRQRDEVERVLKRLPKGNEIIAELADTETGFEVHEMCVVRVDQPADAPPESLLRTLLSVPVMPKVSPKHAAVAFLQLRDDYETIDLKVMSRDGAAMLTVAQQVSTAAFAWMPDGRSLIFTTAMGKADDSIQTIHRLTVLQESGALMKPDHDPLPDGSLLKIEGPDRLPETKTLAMAILPAHQSLQVLPDGRILFASQPITLPAAGTGPELEPRLYLIAADGLSVKVIPTEPGDLPTDLNFFVLSPDGRRVAVVEEGTDAVALVEVSTGRTEIIPAHKDWRCETIPAWKSPTELTFAGLDEKSKTPCWMMWTAGGGTRIISGRWPASVLTDWLSESKPAEPQKDNP